MQGEQHCAGKADLFLPRSDNGRDFKNRFAPKGQPEEDYFTKACKTLQNRHAKAGGASALAPMVPGWPDLPARVRKLVRSLAQTYCIPLPKSILNCRQMIRQGFRR